MMSGHFRSLLLAKRIFRNKNEAPRPAPPPPRFARYASSSGPPPPLARGRKARAISSSQRDPRRSYVSGQLRIERISLPYPPLATCFFLPSKKGRRNADKRWATTAASCDAARALLERARLTAFHHGLTQGSISSQRLSFRPGFLGRGLNGRYPPSPVPVQGSTSHPGRNAGRHDTQAARERTANPPASTAPAPPHGLPPVGIPW
jgi:hypothetical protein